MASKTLVVLTVILLVLSLVALGWAISKPVNAPTSAEGKVLAYVPGDASGPLAEPMSATGQVKVSVVETNTTP